jgi:hypothetical protein
MTIPELKELLKTLGLPLAYLKWAPGQAPELPYLLYYADEDVGFFADDTVYSEGYAVTVEVYSEQKDLELEEKVKNLLIEKHLPYESYEDYLDSEEMFLKAYEFQI